MGIEAPNVNSWKKESNLSSYSPRYPPQEEHMHRYHVCEQEDTKLLWILNVRVGKTASSRFLIGITALA